MISVRRAYLILLALVASLTACGSSDTVLLVDVDQGTMIQPPESISISAYKVDQGVRVQIGSSGDITWTDALKGLGLRLNDDVSGELSVEAVGNPSGIAGPVPVTVAAKKASGPIRLVFRDGAATPLDGGALDGGAGTLDGASLDGVARPLDGGALDGGTEADVPSVALDASEAVDGASSDVATDVAEPIIPGIDAGSSLDATVDIPAPPVFTLAESIDTTAVIPDKLLLKIDPVREHAYVAWTENRVIRIKRWSRNTAAWGEMQELRVEDYSPLYGTLRMAVDNTGKVYLAWLMGQSSDPDAVAGVWICQANPGETLSFSPPQRIVAGRPNALDMAIAGNGVVYLSYTLPGADTAYYSVHAAVFEGTTWKPYAEPLLETLSTEDPVISVAASGIGTAMVVFNKRISGTKRTATFFLSGTTATNAGYLDTASSNGVASRVLAMSREGEATLLWTRDSTGDLYAAKYSALAGWSTPVLVSYDTQREPAVVMADDGTVTVAYGKRSGATYNLNVQSGKLTGTFAAPTPLESDNKSESSGTSDLSAPQMAMDNAGNVLLVFRKKDNDNTASLWGTRLENGVWRAPVLLAKTDTLEVDALAVAVANSGFGVYGFSYREEVWPRTNDLSDKAFVGFFR